MKKLTIRLLFNIKLPFLYLFLITVSIPVFAQQTDEVVIQEARKHIEVLCSEEFAGRGYMDDGHLTAANYIENQFKSLGLTPVVEGGKQASYFQPFSFKVNVVPTVKVQFGNKKLETGKDCILNRMSGSGSGTYTVLDMGYGLKVRPIRPNTAIIIRDGLPPKIQKNPRKKEAYKDITRTDQKINTWLQYKPACIIILKSKLTASLSPYASDIPIIEILESSIPVKKSKTTVKVQVKVRQENIRTQNVLGLIKGTSKPDSVIVISAHYDHLGKQGTAIFPGANDNASGTSMLLSMAKYFSQNPQEHSILFIAFGAEEAGLIGSQFYVEENPVIPLSKISFILNLDLMGNGVDGIMAVGGRDFPNYFERLTKLNAKLKAVPEVKQRSNAPNSDHYFFLVKGVPGFFIYTLGGPKHYHDINDNASTIVLSKYTEVRTLLIQFIESF